MSLRGFLAGVSALVLLAAGAVEASQLSGRIELVQREGGGPVREADPSLAVISFQPSTPPAVRPASRPVEMVTRGKAFVPHVLVITRGTTVRFPNTDPILHNVFSVSSGNRFDLGFYPQGPGKSWTFQQPGVVRVFCNVHHSMVGYILVLATRHFTSPDPRGAFTLSDLPQGEGTLTVWHPRTEAWSRRLSPGQAAPLVVQLPVTRERVPPHLNKFGRSYKRGRRDRYP